MSRMMRWALQVKATTNEERSIYTVVKAVAVSIIADAKMQILKVTRK